jgi:hypothetical protein
MTDVFATLVRRSQASGVLSPVLGSAFERPLAEPMWGEREEVRVAHRPATPIESSGEQRASPSPASTPEDAAARPGALTHRVVETRLRTSEPSAPHDESGRDATPVPPPLDVAAIVAAALRERPRLTRETVVLRQTMIEASAESADRGQANDVRAGDRPPVVIAAPPVVPALATESRPQSAPAPSIEVRIGRIDVTAAAPRPPMAPALPRLPVSRTLTLRDYLARRGRR